MRRPAPPPDDAGRRADPPRSTLVLALGNPLRGDDGVGAAVLEALGPVPPRVRLLDGGTPGLELVLTLRDQDRAIIVDAADLGAPPGTWRLLAPAELRMKTPGLGGTLHGAGLAEALALGDALGLLPRELVILGIQPGEIGWSPGLTPRVAAAIGPVCARIRELLGIRGRPGRLRGQSARGRSGLAAGGGFQDSARRAVRALAGDGDAGPATS